MIATSDRGPGHLWRQTGRQALSEVISFPQNRVRSAIEREIEEVRREAVGWVVEPDYAEDGALSVTLHHSLSDADWGAYWGAHQDQSGWVLVTENGEVCGYGVSLREVLMPFLPQYRL